MAIPKECRTMFIDADALDPARTYRLLSGAVVPRPIAWVTSGTVSRGVNLAPFSSFTWVSTYPAMLGFNIAPRPEGLKDTARNLHEFGEYVVNIAGRDMLGPLHASSEGFSAEISETEHLDLPTVESVKVQTPRLADAPVSMECILREVLQFGQTGSEFFVGEVVAFHVKDEIYDNGKIDTELLKPLSRLGGPRYASLTDIRTMPAVTGG